jgi:hypothetical protein
MSRFSSYSEVNTEACGRPLDPTSEDALRRYNRRVRERHCLIALDQSTCTRKLQRFFAGSVVLFSVGVLLYVTKVVYF